MDSTQAAAEAMAAPSRRPGAEKERDVPPVGGLESLGYLDPKAALQRVRTLEEELLSSKAGHEALVDQFEQDLKRVGREFRRKLAETEELHEKRVQHLRASHEEEVHAWKRRVEERDEALCMQEEDGRARLASMDAVVERCRSVIADLETALDEARHDHQRALSSNQELREYMHQELSRRDAQMEEVEAALEAMRNDTRLPETRAALAREQEASQRTKAERDEVTARLQREEARAARAEVEAAAAARACQALEGHLRACLTHRERAEAAAEDRASSLLRQHARAYADLEGRFVEQSGLRAKWEREARSLAPRLERARRRVRAADDELEALRAEAARAQAELKEATRCAHLYAERVTRAEGVLRRMGAHPATPSLHEGGPSPMVLPLAEAEGGAAMNPGLRSLPSPRSLGPSRRGRPLSAGHRRPGIAGSPRRRGGLRLPPLPGQGPPANEVAEDRPVASLLPSPASRPGLAPAAYDAEPSMVWAVPTCGVGADVRSRAESALMKGPIRSAAGLQESVLSRRAADAQQREVSAQWREEADRMLKSLTDTADIASTTLDSVAGAVREHTAWLERTRATAQGRRGRAMEALAMLEADMDEEEEGEAVRGKASSRESPDPAQDLATRATEGDGAVGGKQARAGVEGGVEDGVAGADGEGTPRSSDAQRRDVAASGDAAKEGQGDDEGVDEEEDENEEESEGRASALRLMARADAQSAMRLAASSGAQRESMGGAPPVKEGQEEPGNENEEESEGRASALRLMARADAQSAMRLAAVTGSDGMGRGTPSERAPASPPPVCPAGDSAAAANTGTAESDGRHGSRHGALRQQWASEDSAGSLASTVRRGLAREADRLRVKADVAAATVAACDQALAHSATLRHTTEQVHACLRDARCEAELPFATVRDEVAAHARLVWALAEVGRWLAAQHEALGQEWASVSGDVISREQRREQVESRLRAMQEATQLVGSLESGERDRFHRLRRHQGQLSSWLTGWTGQVGALAEALGEATSALRRAEEEHLDCIAEDGAAISAHARGEAELLRYAAWTRACMLATARERAGEASSEAGRLEAEHAAAERDLALREAWEEEVAEEEEWLRREEDRAAMLREDGDAPAQGRNAPPVAEAGAGAGTREAAGVDKTDGGGGSAVESGLQGSGLRSRRERASATVLSRDPRFADFDPEATAVAPEAVASLRDRASAARRAEREATAAVARWRHAYAVMRQVRDAGSAVLAEVGPHGYAAAEGMGGDDLSPRSLASRVSSSTSVRSRPGAATGAVRPGAAPARTTLRQSERRKEALAAVVSAFETARTTGALDGKEEGEEEEREGIASEGNAIMGTAESPSRQSDGATRGQSPVLATPGALQRLEAMWWRARALLDVAAPLATSFSSGTDPSSAPPLTWAARVAEESAARADAERDLGVIVARVLQGGKARAVADAQRQRARVEREKEQGEAQVAAQRRAHKEEVAALRSSSEASVTSLQQRLDEARAEARRAAEEGDRRLARASEEYARARCELEGEVGFLRRQDEGHASHVQSLKREAAAAEAAAMERARHAEAEARRKAGEVIDLSARLRTAQEEGARRAGLITSLEAQVRGKEEEVAAAKRAAEEEAHAHALQLRDARRETLDRDEAVRVLFTEPDTLLRALARAWANLSGRSRAQNARLLHLCAPEVLLVLCKSPLLDARANAARALGRLAWNGDVDDAVVSFFAREHWAELRVKLVERSSALRRAEAGAPTEAIRTAASRAAYARKRPVLAQRQARARGRAPMPLPEARAVEAAKCGVEKGGALMPPSAGPVEEEEEKQEEEEEEAEGDARVEAAPVPAGGGEVKEGQDPRRRREGSATAPGANTAGQEAVLAHSESAPVLVSLLGSAELAVLRAACDALALLALSEAGQARVGAERGALPQLVRLATTHRDAELTVLASSALGNLCYRHTGHKMGAGEAGAVDGLLSRVRHHNDPHVLAAACGALATLVSGCLANQRRMMAADGVRALLSLCEDGRVVEWAEAQAAAAEALANATQRPDEGREEPAPVLGMDELRSALRVCASANRAVRYHALLFVGNLAESDELRAALGHVGAVEAAMLGAESAGAATRAAALWTLANLLWCVDNQNRATPYLCQLLVLARDADEAVGEQAFAALGNALFYHEPNRQALHDEEGAVVTLVGGARHPSPAAAAEAARCVGTAAYSDPLSQALAEAGAVRALVELTRRPDAGDGALRHAAFALGQLFALDEGKRLALDAGAVEALVAVYGKTGQAARQAAERALGMLSDPGRAQSLSKHSGRFGVAALVELCAEDNPLVQKMAAESLAERMWASQETQGAVLAAGGMEVLLPMAEAPERHAAARALWALRNTLYQNREAREQFGGLGGVERVAAVLQRAGAEPGVAAAGELGEACAACLINACMGHLRNSRRLLAAALDLLLSVAERGEDDVGSTDAGSAEADGAGGADGTSPAAEAWARAAGVVRDLLEVIGPYNWYVCDNCGSKENGGRFCGQCGHAIEYQA